MRSGTRALSAISSALSNLKRCPQSQALSAISRALGTQAPSAPSGALSRPAIEGLLSNQPRQQRRQRAVKRGTPRPQQLRLRHVEHIVMSNRLREALDHGLLREQLQLLETAQCVRQP